MANGVGEKYRSKIKKKETEKRNEGTGEKKSRSRKIQPHPTSHVIPAHARRHEKIHPLFFFF